MTKASPAVVEIVPGASPQRAKYLAVQDQETDSAQSKRDVVINQSDTVAGSNGRFADDGDEIVRLRN